jgi:hypothetical protein
MALKLTISGIQVDLLKSQALELNQKSDFFNLEVQEATFSIPFNLPKTPNNRKLFKHVDIPASNQPITEEFSAVVEVDGLVAKEGVFVLTAIKDDFEGFIKADAGVFSPIKDELIGGFVDDVVELQGNYPLTQPMTKEQWGETRYDKFKEAEFLFHDTDEAISTYFSQLFDGRFDNKESNISFPLMWSKKMSELFTEKDGQQPLDYSTYKGVVSLINHTRTFNSDTFTVVGEDAAVYTNLSFPATEFRPCVKLKHILAKILESQGWILHWQISDYLLNQKIMIAGKGSMIFPMKVGEFLPEMKVSDFVNNFRKMGVAFNFDSAKKKVVAKKMSDVLTDSNQKDLTSFVSPKVELVNLETDTDSGFGFWFENDEERTGEKIDPFTEWLYRPASNQNYGNLVLDKATNSYLKVEGPFDKQEGANTGFQESIWSKGFKTDAFVENLDLHQKAVTDFIPVTNQRRVFETYTNYFLWFGQITRNDSQPQYLNFVNRRMRELIASEEVFQNSLQIRFLDFPELGDALYNTYLNPGFGSGIEPKSELLVLFVNNPFPQGNTVSEERAQLSYYLENQDLPRSTTIPNYYNLPHIQEEEEGKPLIALWHGIQEGYRFASSGNYSPNGSVQLCSTAIRWEGADGLESQLFQEFTQVSKNRKSFTYEGKLKLSDCLNFDPFQKVLIDWVEFLVISFKAKYRNDRVNERVGVELELRRV